MADNECYVEEAAQAVADPAWEDYEAYEAPPYAVESAWALLELAFAFRQIGT